MGIHQRLSRMPPSNIQIVRMHLFIDYSICVSFLQVFYHIFLNFLKLARCSIDETHYKV